jgi:hypothetical protein
MAKTCLKEKEEKEEKENYRRVFVFIIVNFTKGRK